MSAGLFKKINFYQLLSLSKTRNGIVQMNYIIMLLASYMVIFILLHFHSAEADLGLLQHQDGALCDNS